MVKKLFEKHETLMCMLLIVGYIVVNSFCMQNFGLLDYRTTIVNTFFSAALILLMISLNRITYYGLTKVRNPKKYLYFFPLAIIVSMNLWNGFHINHTYGEIVCHILTMFNIGFIEEIIFRGFLFKMMEKDNVKIAIWVNSVTFGIGHIVNVLNGAELVPTCLQICYAMAIGYLFVIIFYRSKSLLPCIVTHALFNACSIFSIENTWSMYIVPVILTVLPLGYAIYIDKTVGDRTYVP